jgi:hypothetical protein
MAIRTKDSKGGKVMEMTKMEKESDDNRASSIATPASAHQ